MKQTKHLSAYPLSAASHSFISSSIAAISILFSHRVQKHKHDISHTHPGTRPAPDEADYQNALNFPVFMIHILYSVLWPCFSGYGVPCPVPSSVALHPLHRTLQEGCMI